MFENAQQLREGLDLKFVLTLNYVHRKFFRTTLEMINRLIVLLRICKTIIT